MFTLLLVSDQPDFACSSATLYLAFSHFSSFSSFFSHCLFLLYLLPPHISILPSSPQLSPNHLSYNSEVFPFSAVNVWLDSTDKGITGLARDPNNMAANMAPIATFESPFPRHFYGEATTLLSQPEVGIPNSVAHH